MPLALWRPFNLLCKTLIYDFEHALLDLPKSIAKTMSWEYNEQLKFSKLFLKQR